MFTVLAEAMPQCTVSVCFSFFSSIPLDGDVDSVSIRQLVALQCVFFMAGCFGVTSHVVHQHAYYDILRDGENMSLSWLHM